MPPSGPMLRLSYPGCNMTVQRPPNAMQHLGFYPSNMLPRNRAYVSAHGWFLTVNEAVHPHAIRSNFAAIMKSFSCKPLIFFVCSETVA
jgi:hypothetical protein